jgi:hypothetical protein
MRVLILTLALVCGASAASARDLPPEVFTFRAACAQSTTAPATEKACGAAWVALGSEPKDAALKCQMKLHHYCQLAGQLK